jgi:two-component system sensor histidine kinase KdpD
MSNLHTSGLPSTTDAEKWGRSENLSRSWRIKSIRAQVVPFCWSVLGIAVITWLALRIGLNALTGGFLYLIIVVFAAASGGFWSGTLTSIVAAACVDFFFLPPLFHFNIDNPMDWVSLGTFEFTALVITLLQDRAQLKAAEAAAARQDSERLFNAARGVLLLDQTGALGNQITSLIREAFELAGVVLFDAPTAGVFVSGKCAPNTEQGVRDACSQNSDTFSRDTETWFCALRAGARPVGGLALCGTRMPGLMAQAIASLCAMSLERARSFEKETHAEAARQVEQLRSAVVEALAHQIKTPLCVIQAASSTLPALGELTETQAELVTSIDDQSAKLNDLVTRLLGATGLESAQIEPHLAPVLLSDLVKAAIGSVEDPAQRERFRVSVEGEEVQALADGKLMIIAFTQFVDNAVKYSVPRSPIVVRVTMDPGEISVRVHNQGGVIAPADRERIFERFFRTAEARQGPAGTGLGLSIAKRIVDAHHGRIWVESGSAEGTTFGIVLPRAPGEGPGTSQVPEPPGSKL